MKSGSGDDDPDWLLSPGPGDAEADAEGAGEGLPRSGLCSGDGDRDTCTFRFFCRAWFEPVEGRFLEDADGSATAATWRGGLKGRRLVFGIGGIVRGSRLGGSTGDKAVTWEELRVVVIASFNAKARDIDDRKSFHDDEQHHAPYSPPPVLSRDSSCA
jgi:hypothetical protein